MPAAKASPIPALIIVIGVVIAIAATFCFTTVPAGHVGVVTVFGKVQTTTLPEGLHFKLPWHAVTAYDGRQKHEKLPMDITTQDQLQSSIDISVQFRLNKSLASQVMQETGSLEQAWLVHLQPKLRSLVREYGKSIENAQELFLKEQQTRLQSGILADLSAYCQPRGIDIDAVLIRSLKPPAFILKAIESKKVREQEAEKQKAELERYKTEQEQLLARATAEKKAAEEEAQKRRILADAQAYEIKQINEAISQSPAYIQLQALEALKEISKDPSTKLYFLDGDSPNPLPLMHMGETK